MQLSLLKDALEREIPNSTYKLVLPYLPYARQDRVACKGESHSLAVFCNAINNLGFSEVLVDDPHSIVSLALIKNLRVKEQWQCLAETLVKANTQFKWDAVVSPDAGATKKAAEVASRYQVPLIECSKKRDPLSGKLSDPKILVDLPAGVGDVLIVDDICDGGYTFIQLSKVLKEAGIQTVDLYVTHGIFSKGKELEGISDIFCLNDFKKEEL